VEENKEGKMPHFIERELSNKVLDVLYEVHSVLGAGLLESVYENAVCEELKKQGLLFIQQKLYKVVYKGIVVGNYIADIVVDNTIIIECKSVKELNNNMKAQLLNYLKISGLPVGYLINFRNSMLEKERYVM
jgi:GxxExxY protein